MDFMEKARKGVKLVGAGSVQMMLGGITAAVIPANVSLMYKAAMFVGSCVLSMCVSEPVSKTVDKQFNELQEATDQMKDYIRVMKSKKEDYIEETE